MTDIMMDAEELFRRYQCLQRYVAWSDDDARRLAALAGPIEPYFASLVDDFYAEIERQPDARKVITGGARQIERLKRTLLEWLHELFSGRYDAEFVVRRRRIGLRHAEIGLDQVYTNTALSRLRTGLIRGVRQIYADDIEPGIRAIESLHKLLDLELAIIEDAYQAEHLLRQKRVERLVALGQMAGGVAHEMRNPLNVIKTSVYYLLNAGDHDSEKTAEHLKRIERQVGLADNVISAMANFARMPLPDMRPIDPRELVEEVLQSSPLPENVAVAVRYPERPGKISVDAGQIAIVLSNLFRNACEAMATKGGTLNVVISSQADVVEIAVEDNGHGIPPEDIHRVLEPFYSTKARGIGLGLAITRAIVQNHQGELRVSSVLGVGTRMAVRLPRARE
jgi:signal transduction histidine kinase